MTTRFESINHEMDGRILPHAREVEMAVLGAMMRDSGAEILVQSIVRAEYFYVPSHRKIYSAMQVVAARGERIDLHTTACELERRGDLEKCRGRAGLVDIADSVFTAANVEAHAKIIREKWVLRQLIYTCEETVATCLKAPGDSQQLIDSLNRSIGEIMVNDSGAIKHIAEVGMETLRIIDDYKANRNKPKLSWGYPKLDFLTGGLHLGHLTLIAGRPGMGKTSLAINVALRLARSRNANIGLFTIEMAATEINEAMGCIEARIDGKELRRGTLSNDDHVKIAVAIGEIAELPIYVDNSKDLSAHQLKARVHRMVKSHKVNVVIIDYLQLLKGPRSQNREQEIAALSRACKVIAQECGVCMIVLSQLSRQPDLRPNHEPELADLRDSGSLEQDADEVIFAYRPIRYYKNAHPRKALLLLKKQRRGPLGTIDCLFFDTQGRFEELDPKSVPPDWDRQ